MNDSDYGQPPKVEDQDEHMRSDAETDLDDESQSLGRSLPRRIAAAILVLVFATFVLGGVLRVLFGPDLGFIRQSQKLSSSPKVRQWKKAVVQIEAHPRGAGPSHFGTGFNIDGNGLVITNRHVVEGAADLTVTFPEGGVVMVTGVKMHPDVDLAIVTLNGKSLPTLALNDGSLPTPGEDVLVIGNPLGFPGIVSEGTILGTVRYGSPREQLVELSAPIHPGSSGSPVLDSSGKVLAVVFAVIEDSGSQNDKGNNVPHALAVPTAYLHDLVPEPPVKPPLRGIARHP